MTLEQLQTLEQAIDDALEATGSGNTHDIAVWVRRNRRRVFDEHIEILGTEGLEARIRLRRKKRAPVEEIHSSRNLCLDFGLPPMDLDSEISVPRDMENLLYGPCDWKEPDEATIPELDKHIALLEAQGRSALASAQSWRRVRQAAARIARGRLELTIGELRQMAREDGATK